MDGPNAEFAGDAWPYSGTADGVDQARGLTCLTTTFCYGWSDWGYVSFYDGSSWSAPTLIPQEVANDSVWGVTVTCDSSSFCWAQDGSDAGDGGEIAFYYEGSWVTVGNPFGGDFYAASLNCLPTTVCYAETGDGEAAIFADGAQVGATSEPFSGIGSVFYASMACATESDCISTALIEVGTYPFEHDVNYLSGFDGTGWSPIDGDFYDTKVGPSSCPTDSLCASNSDGSVVFFDGTSWSTPVNPFSDDLESGDLVEGVQCESATFCMATSVDGFSSVFNGTSWTSPVQVGNPTCLAGGFCYSTSSGAGGEISTYDSGGWSLPVNPFSSDGQPSDDIESATCVSASLCFASSQDGLASTFDGSSWSSATDPYAPTGGLYTLTCVNSDQCGSDGGAEASDAPYGLGVSALEADSPSTANCRCAPVQPWVGDPVNTSTGDFKTTTTALSVPGAGAPLSLTASYNSLAAQDETSGDESAGPLGYGWSDSLGMSVTVDPTTEVATVTEENGAQITFAPYSADTSPWWCMGATNYCPTAPRYIATLNHNSDATWTLVRSLSGTQTFTFDMTGQLTQETDTSGDSLSSSAGTPGSGQCPSSATSCTVWTNSASGRSITLVYDSSGDLTSAIDQSGNKTTFCHFGQSCAPSTGGQTGDLASVTQYAGTSLAQTTQYSYDSTNTTSDLQHDMITVVQPGGGSSAETTNSYGSGGRIVAQTEPGGAEYTLGYSGSSYATDNGSDGGGSTAVTFYPDGEGSGEPSTTNDYSYLDGVMQSETVDTGGSDKVESYTRDLTTLLPTSSTDLDGNTASESISGTENGTTLPSANVLFSTDGDGNTTQFAYTSENMPWCEVDPADNANGVSCPSSMPSAPPAPGTYIGYTLTLYNSQGQVQSQTDPLGNTTVYGYTSGVSGVPDNLLYCTIDPVQYAAEYAVDPATAGICPSYGTNQSGVSTKTYDSAGDMTSSTDADGNTTSYTYGSSANPTLPTVTTDPDGQVTTDTYNPEGEILTQVVTGTTGSYTATTQYAYDSEGRKYCEVDPLEYANSVRCPTSPPTSPPTGTPGYTDTIYNADGEVISTTNPIGGTTQYAYDGAGNQYCSVSPDNYANGTSCPTSLPLTVPTPSSDPYPGATIHTFNALNQLVQTTNPLGGITLDVYDPAGNVTQKTVQSNDSTDEADVVTQTTYDADNRVSSTTVGYGSASPSTTLTSYDPNGNAFCTVSANAYAAGSSAYQCPAWQPGWIVTPADPESLYSTSPSSDQANNVTTTFFDADGNQVQTTNPDIQTTISVVDPDGRAYCTIDPVNVAASVSCAAPGASPNPGTQTTTYDSDGNVLSTTDPNGDVTSNTYDPDGNKTSTTNADSQTTTYCYYWEDGSGQCANGAPSDGGAPSMLYSTTTPDTSADPSGETTTTTYGPGGATDQTTNPAGVTSYTYDANGDVTATDYSDTAGGYGATPNVTTTYNPDGSRQQMTDGTGTTTYSEDALGDVTEQQFSAASGSGLSDQTTDFGFFSTGALQSVTYPSYGDVSEPQATYTYNPTGQMASVTDWGGNTVAFNYDADGNETNQANDSTSGDPGGNSSMSMTYDNADQQTDMSTSFTYDSSSGDSDAEDSGSRFRGGGSTSSLDSLASAIGFPPGSTSGGGSSSDSAAHIDSSDSDCSDTLTFEIATGSSGGGSRNADGQVTDATTNVGDSCDTLSGNTYMSYDSGGRLTYQGFGPQGTAPDTYAYDSAGSPTTISTTSFASASQGFDNAGELLTSDSGTSDPSTDLTYTYDSIGDRTNVSDATAADDGDYGYDQTGQMVGYSNAVADASYLYNGDGLEVGTTTGAGTTQFTWATLNSEPLILSDQTSDYIYGPGTTPVEQVDLSTSDPTFINFNQADGASSYVLTDGSGNLVNLWDYDATGANELLDLTSPTGFGYAGEYQDATSGFFGMRARWYDPTTDGFTSVDPDLASTDQPYSYAGDDPVNGSDPSGQACSTWQWVAAPGVCAANKAIYGSTTSSNSVYTPELLLGYGQANVRCTSGASGCGDVLTSVVQLWTRSSSSSRVSQSTTLRMLTLVQSHLAIANDPEFPDCQQFTTCIPELIPTFEPGPVGSSTAVNYFQLSHSNTLVWWAQSLSVKGVAPLVELADQIELIYESGLPEALGEVSYVSPAPGASCAGVTLA